MKDKKSVQFSEITMTFFIPTCTDKDTQILLWWSKTELEHIKNDTKRELLQCIREHSLYKDDNRCKIAQKILYQSGI